MSLTYASKSLIWDVVLYRYVFTDHFGSVEWPVAVIRKTVTEYSASVLQEILTGYQLLPRQHHERDWLQTYGALTKHGNIQHPIHPPKPKQHFGLLNTLTF